MEFPDGMKGFGSRRREEPRPTVVRRRASAHLCPLPDSPLLDLVVLSSALPSPQVIEQCGSTAGVDAAGPPVGFQTYCLSSALSGYNRSDTFSIELRVCFSCVPVLC